MVIAAVLTRLTHKTVIQLHLMAEYCTIFSSRSRRPVRKLLIHPRRFFVVTKKFHTHLTVVLLISLLTLVVEEENCCKSM